MILGILLMLNTQQPDAKLSLKKRNYPTEISSSAYMERDALERRRSWFTYNFTALHAFFLTPDIWIDPHTSLVIANRLQVILYREPLLSSTDGG